jgi:Transposase DDE domain
MISVTQMEEILRECLETNANSKARETGFIQRERNFNGADFVQMMAFGHLAHPKSTLDQLTQVAQLREVQISRSGLQQRFTESAAMFLQAVLEDLVKHVLGTEPVEVELLKRFTHVILEDSSSIVLPAELEDLWPGCGGGAEGTTGQTEASLKLHVRWDLSTGALWGPRLTAGRVSDQNSPFQEDALPKGSLYVTDLGYFSLLRLVQLQQQKIFFCMRPKSNTVFWDRQGKKRLQLLKKLPRKVGQSKVIWVCLGQQQQLKLRLIAVRVPEEVVDQRRKQLEEKACKHGRKVTDQQWEMAQWTLILTNAPAKRLGIREVLILLRERWAIELLFKLWKSEGKVDEWRSQHPWRVLCELYGKLIAMVVQHWLLVLGCWHDPFRSLIKASAVVREVALDVLDQLKRQQSLTPVCCKLCRMMRSGCRVDQSATHPCLAQLLVSGLDWPLT